MDCEEVMDRLRDYRNDTIERVSEASDSEEATALAYQMGKEDAFNVALDLIQECDCHDE